MKTRYYQGIKYHITDRNYKYLTAVSFGFILLFNSKYEREFTIRHEYGHQLQFKKLGPLYPFVIGIPSLIGNLAFRNKWIRKHFDYYKQPWEAWANKLAFKEKEV